MSQQSSPITLGNSIQELCHKLEGDRDEQGDGTSDAASCTREASIARGKHAEHAQLVDRLRDTTGQLMTQVAEPDEIAHEYISRVLDATCLRVACELRLFTAVPTDRGVTVKELSEACERHPKHIGRIMRYLVTCGFFDETEEKTFVHSKASLALAQNAALQAMFEFTQVHKHLPWEVQF